MSMAYSSAYAYVARAFGQSTDSDRTDAAKDAIKAAIADLNVRRDWKYLLMDTRNGFTVAVTCTATATGTNTLTAASSGFAGVNVSQTFSGLVAGTVSSIISDTSLTVSLTATATSTATAGNVLFSGDIPVISGTDEYNFPTDIKRIYSARLLTTNPRPLAWKDQREWDRMVFNQSNPGVPRWFNNFNDATFTTARQYGKLRLMPSPGQDDTLRVRYFRSIAEPSADADLLDMPDRYIYAMLTLARYYYLQNFDAESARMASLETRAEFLINRAIRDDRIQTYDKGLVAVPYIEWGSYDDPYYDNSGAYY